jgi:hypothetical protein
VVQLVVDSMTEHGERPPEKKHGRRSHADRAPRNGHLSNPWA